MKSQGSDPGTCKYIENINYGFFTLLKNDDNVITFWVDDPNDIPDILDASSFFDDSPSALLEKFSKPVNPGVYPENDNIQQPIPHVSHSFPSQGVNAQSLPRDFEEKGTTLIYPPPNYDTSHSHNSYTSQHDSQSLTKRLVKKNDS